ncbi:MAG: hypothetical protein JO115_20445 [Pseudonocardiales bacterium]|nr:hypothetical protein [Pseudonocardiales bacterium]
MVEADYLRAYRSKGVSLQRLRPFIAECRERFGLRYPLAHLRPFTDGRRLLLEAQTEAGLTGEPGVVYELALMPDGPDSPVQLEPGVASGASTVGGVRTEVLREQYEVGEDTRDIADMFGLAHMHRWRDMERMRERPSLYIFGLTRTRMTEIDLI